MKYQLRFYITPSGKQTVQDCIRKLEASDITKIGRGIEILKEYGLNLLGTKWVKKVNSKPDIFELRITGKKQIRLLFSEVNRGEFMVVNIFVKKSPKTPIQELNLAINRVLTFITK